MEKLFRTFILKAIFLIIILPINVILIIPPAYYLVFSVDTSEDEIANIILKLNSKKAYGYDDNSIAMLKLCAPAVSKPLNLIFEGRQSPKFALFFNLRNRISFENLNEQKKRIKNIKFWRSYGLSKFTIFRSSQKRIEIFPRYMTSLEHRGSKSGIIFFKTSSWQC